MTLLFSRTNGHTDEKVNIIEWLWFYGECSSSTNRPLYTFNANVMPSHIVYTYPPCIIAPTNIHVQTNPIHPNRPDKSYYGSNSGDCRQTNT